LTIVVINLDEHQWLWLLCAFIAGGGFTWLFF
jgi:hypothetical protein